MSRFNWQAFIVWLGMSITILQSSCLTCGRGYLSKPRTVPVVCSMHMTLVFWTHWLTACSCDVSCVGSSGLWDHQVFLATSPSHLPTTITASTLAYFGFLRASEFTISSLSAFIPLIHLSVSDIAVDSHTWPSCLEIRIKAYKTDPFWKGCHIYISMGCPPLCTLSALMRYLPL